MKSLPLEIQSLVESVNLESSATDTTVAVAKARRLMGTRFEIRVVRGPQCVYHRSLKLAQATTFLQGLLVGIGEIPD